MNLDCTDACPQSIAFQAAEAIAKADKATLIHAIRALVTVELWEYPEEDLRAALTAGIAEKAFHDFEVYQALTGGK